MLRTTGISLLVSLLTGMARIAEVRVIDVMRGWLMSARISLHSMMVKALELSR